MRPTDPPGARPRRRVDTTPPVAARREAHRCEEALQALERVSREVLRELEQLDAS